MSIRALIGSILLLASGSLAAQSLSLLDARVVEGDTGTSVLVFEARLSAPATQRVSFNFDVSDGTAVVSGDYTDVSLVGLLSIPVGGTSLAISVPVKGDTAVEPNEYLNATLTGVLGASLADGNAKGLVINDDHMTLVSAPLDPGASSGSTGSAAYSTSMSRDGRYVAFGSTASDLVSNGSAGGVVNVYVSDTRTGSIRLASPATDGGYANADCLNAKLSADGRFVVFESAATNLVAGATQATSKIYRRDLVTGTTVQVSVGFAGAAADFSSYNPVISADGRYVAFESGATNLLAASDTNGQLDVFIRDMQTGVTSLVSVKAANSQVWQLAYSSNPSISDDGRYVAFVSDGLIAEDTWQQKDIYRRDMQLGTTIRVSVATSNGGNTDGDSYTPQMSADGRYVVFRSTATNLGAGPAPVHYSQIYRRDIQAGTTALVTYDASGTKSQDTQADYPTMSADGRYISYQTYSKVTAEDTNTFQDIYLRDMQSGTNTLISKGWNGVATQYHDTGMGVVSGDGRFIAFISNSVEMLPGDNNGNFDLFLVELAGNASLPALSVADTSIQELDVDRQLTIRVALSAPAPQAISFDLASADGSAIAGPDFGALNLTGLTIAAGQQSIDVPATIRGDDDFETDETFNVYVSNVQNARVPDPQSLHIIGNDDTAPVVPALSIADVSTTEGNAGTKTMTFTVTLSVAGTNPVMFDIATSNGSANAGSDYVARSLAGQVIPAGQTSKQFDVVINGDTAPEINEAFVVTVSNVGAATVADGVATGTINNDDGGGTLSINDVSIVEGNSGTKLATFTVTLSAAQAGPVTFDIATSNGTALSGSDYVAKSTSGASIAAGATSTNFAVTINGDTAGEADEIFSVTISNSLGAGVSDAQGVGTITNDDTPSLSIGDASIIEGHSGTKLATFTVQLSDIAAWPVTFNAATANGTATAGSDFVALALNGQSIAAGQTSKTLSVTINGDTTFEPNETFALNLSNVVGATVTDGSATGTITNDDPSNNPVISIADARVLEGNGGTAQLEFRISLSAPATSNISFKLTTTDKGATAPSDYTALVGASGAIPAGQTSTTVFVAVNGDTTIEVNETLFVAIDELVGNVVPGDLQAIGQVLNDDGNILIPVPIDPLDLSANDTSIGPSMTPDGRYVAFYSRATDLSYPLDQVHYDIYLRDTILGTTTLVSRNVNGGRGNQDSYAPSISDDGRYVVFVSAATDLVSNDTNGFVDVFRRDMQTGVTQLVTVPANGVGMANENTYQALISGNGRQVVFNTNSTNLIANGASGLMKRDMQVGVTQRLDLNYVTDPFNRTTPNSIDGISRDGRYLVFSAKGGNFVINDGQCDYYTTPDLIDHSCQKAYWADTATGVVKLVHEVREDFYIWPRFYRASSVSADGRWVGFFSDMNDVNWTMNAFVRDTQEDKTYIASIGPGGQLANGRSTFPIVSPDGTYVAFRSSASNLVANDTNGKTDAFVRPIAGTSTVRIGVAVDGGEANDDTAPVSISNGARYVALVSNASNLVLSDTNGVTDAFVAENPGAVGGNADLASLVPGIGAMSPAFAPVATSYTMSVTASSIRFTPVVQQPGSTVTVNGVAVPSGRASQSIPLSFGTNVVTVVVTAADGMTKKTTTVTVTRENASYPVLSIDDASISEGNSGTKQLNFTVRLSAPAAANVGFNLATANGTAIAGADYLAVQLDSQVMPAGATSKTFAVSIKGDAMLEADETFFLDLSAVTGANVGDARGQGTITNDDEGDGPVLTIRDADFVVEGEPGQYSEAVFTISLSKPAAVPVVFDIATSDLSASTSNYYVPGDYLDKTTLGVSIPAGSTSTEFRVSIGGDSEDETNERFQVTLSNVSGALLGDGVAVGTIIDNDGPDSPIFSISDASVSEGNSGTKLATFKASISSPTDVPVTFAVYTVDETARAGTDYVATTFPNLVIPVGSTSTTFSVEVMGDTLVEGDESFEIQSNNHSGIAGFALFAGPTRGRILEDDAPRLPMLSVDDVRIAEGNNGHPLAIFTVSLSESSASPVSFSFATSDNSATSPSDFTARTLAGLVIPAGRTTKRVAVSLNGDNELEQQELFIVNVTDVVGATIEDGLGVAEIVNDDEVGTEQALSVGDVSIAEGDSGTKMLTVGVDLGVARASSVFFDIATSNGSAAADSDYVANTLLHQEIPAGTTHRDFSITIKGDTVKEPDETILVTLANVSGTYASDPVAVATILDEESGGTEVTPELSIADFDVSEGNAGGRPAYVTISLSAAGILPVEFDLDLVNLTATSGSDYQSVSLSRVTIPAGETSKSIPLTIYGDTATEADETFMAVVTSVSGASVTDDTAIGKIVNDDGIVIPALSIADVSFTEGPVGDNVMTFTVSLSSPAPASVYFDIAAIEGTAKLGYDYVFRTTGFTIEAGQLSRTFTVIIAGDEVAEADETFTINVLNVAGATVVDGSAIGRILNDDGYTQPFISISDATVTEGNSGYNWMVFTISLSAPLPSTTRFRIYTEGVTAVKNEDYYPLNQLEESVDFEPGETSIYFGIPIYGDTTFESDEIFHLIIDPFWAQSGTITKGVGVGTIINDDIEGDDPTPALSIGDVSVAEGDTGARTATFYVVLSTPAPSGGVSFNITTANTEGTANAATAGSDFGAVSPKTMTIAAGQSSATFAVKVLGDTRVESDEVFNVVVSNVSGATVTRAEAIGTIVNDDNVSLQDSNSDTTTPSDMTSIAAIQGTGMLSPMIGKQVLVQGIVTAVRKDGFFLQTPDAKRDADPATSDAIFVFTRVPPNKNAARGNVVEVAGQVREVAYHSGHRELTTTSIEADKVSLIASGNKLPQAIVLNASILRPDRSSTWLERFESMRVTMPKMLVVAPTGGRINVATAAAISDGRFYGVVYGTARPFREPGIPSREMTGVDKVGKAPVFDENPERMHVDSLGLAEAIAMSVDVGDVITGIVGVLAQANDSYSLFTDTNAKPQVISGAAPRAVSVPSASEFTIGHFNARRFFDDVDDPVVNEPVLTKGAYALRLAKTANAICDYMHSPDIVGIAEVEKQSTLSDLADAVNSNTGNVLFPNSCNKNPGYRALMAKANSASGNLGFLVSTANVRPGIPRVQVLAVVEEGRSAKFKRVDGSSEALFERPPLLLRAQLNKAKGDSETLTVIVNQLQSTAVMDDSEQASYGWANRSDYSVAKRRAQMQFLAALLNARRSGNARERVVMLGGFESNEFSNGKDDLMGLIAAPAGLQPMINMTSRMPQHQRYSVVRSGNAEAVDHVLVSKALLDGSYKLRTEFARIDADFGEDNTGDFQVPVRVSDHDPLVLYLGPPGN